MDTRIQLGFFDGMLLKSYESWTDESTFDVFAEARLKEF